MCSVPDNQIGLTEAGKDQSAVLGQRLKSLLGNESVKFFVSPFRRTRETYEGLAKSFASEKLWVRLAFGLLCLPLVRVPSHVRCASWYLLFFAILSFIPLFGERAFLLELFLLCLAVLISRSVRKIRAFGNRSGGTCNLPLRSRCVC